MMLSRLLHQLKAEDGVTLVETIVALGILTAALSLVGTPMVGALRQGDSWRQDIIATVTLQRAGTWLSKDTINAETTSLTDGGAPVDNVAFDWHDLDGTPHTAIYALNGTNLERTCDGLSLIVARNVTAVGFSQASNVLTFSLSVMGGSGNEESKTTTYYLRSLQ